MPQRLDQRGGCGRDAPRVVGELSLDRCVDVPVDVVGAERVDDSVCRESCDDLRFRAGQAHGDTVGLGDLVQLGELRRPLRIDEIDAFQVEHDRVHLGLVVLDHRP